MRKGKLFRDKKGLIQDYLGWILISAGILIVVLIGIAIITGKGNNMIEYIKNLLRFGR